jgi:hypothetical protein
MRGYSPLALFWLCVGLKSLLFPRLPSDWCIGNAKMNLPSLIYIDMHCNIFKPELKFLPYLCFSKHEPLHSYQ